MPAEKLAHLQLWESVLRGKNDLPPEKLDDPCMRQVREHQLKIEGLQEQAVKLRTTVQRVAAMPHVWSEPSHYKPRKRKECSQGPAAEVSRSRPRERSRGIPHSHRGSLRSQPSADVVSMTESRVMGRSDSWRSKQVLMKMSDEARAKRSKSWGSTPTSFPYRRLTGDSDSEFCPPPRRLAEKIKRVVVDMDEETPRHRDRRSSRVNPPRRPPVVYPEEGPPMMLLSCDVEGGRRVMKPLGSTDFIIPRYYRPHAPNLLRAAKTLDELYRLGNAMFDVPYPPMDSHNWNMVVSSRAEKKSNQIKKAQEAYPVKTFRLVK
ncbi:uncharacterized protein LOC126290095 [Schistocerca gregaria]|uniref:uncharacterized protein LOC126290095 n=1 Tax=Schistocerca gregaria TaxID=7010 RepID=UPI00211E8CF6|nr:uncharacterized protein LOC126290095 [Schistocerca gregaria]